MTNRTVDVADDAGAEREDIDRGVRLLRFIDSKQWRTSKANNANVWRDALVGCRSYRVTVFARDNQFCACVALSKDNVKYTDKYAKREQAMSAAFEIVDAIKVNAP